MPALELLTGYAVAPGTTLTALTMASGNSLTVRNAPENSDIRLLQTWVHCPGGDSLRIRSPQLHDNVQGLRIDHVSSEIDPLLPAGFWQPLVPQDTLVVEIAGSATAGDVETVSMLLYYSDLPGISARLTSPDEVRSSFKNLLSVENTLSLGTSGGYSGEETIAAEYDLLKANTDYAILGYQVGAECATVRWRSADSGNLGFGGPGNELDKQITASWFVRLSNSYGLPLIPVFNSANKSNLLVDGAQDENGTDVTLQTFLAELG